MTHTRIAYMPLATYPEAISDEAILAAAAFAAPLGCTLRVRTFAVEFPRVSSGLGDLLIDIPDLVHAAEEKSRAECHRLEGLLSRVAAARTNLHYTSRKVTWGAVPDEAAAEARYLDLTLLPWSGETVSAQDISEAVVFGSGRPIILVPPSARPASLDQIAVAWDASRVVARALGDALPHLVDGGLISVLTVRDEKQLSGSHLAEALSSSLEKRGFNAKP